MASWKRSRCERENKVWKKNSCRTQFTARSDRICFLTGCKRKKRNWPMESPAGRCFKAGLMKINFIGVKRKPLGDSWEGLALQLRTSFCVIAKSYIYLGKKISIFMEQYFYMSLKNFFPFIYKEANKKKMGGGKKPSERKYILLYPLQIYISDELLNSSLNLDHAK